METSKGKPVRFADVQQRSVLTVLQESLQDFSEHEGAFMTSSISVSAV